MRMGVLVRPGVAVDEGALVPVAVATAADAAGVEPLAATVGAMRAEPLVAGAGVAARSGVRVGCAWARAAAVEVGVATEPGSEPGSAVPAVAAAVGVPPAIGVPEKRRPVASGPTVATTPRTASPTVPRSLGWIGRKFPPTYSGFSVVVPGRVGSHSSATPAASPPIAAEAASRFLAEPLPQLTTKVISVRPRL